MITVEDLLELFIEPNIQEIAVYDLNKEEEVFHGKYDDCPDHLRCLDVQSIDNTGPYGSGAILTINVETDEE